MEFFIKEESTKFLNENTNKQQNNSAYLSIMTYNVLMDFDKCFLKAIFNHDKRYEYQINILFPRFSPDIICLQEANDCFIKHLSKSPFISINNYTWSEPSKSTKDSKDSHYPIILSKLIFFILHNEKRKVFALFQKENLNFIVINLHLRAFEDNAKVRSKEMAEVSKILEELFIKFTNLTQENDFLSFELLKSKGLSKEVLLVRLTDALVKNNVFLMGDLNLHYPNENISMN